VNYGASTWVSGDSRSITVTVQNTGTSTWSDDTPDINVGVRWNTNGSNWNDFMYRQNAGSIAPGASQTYTFSDMQARNATANGTTPNPPTYTSALANGTNNLNFSLVYEGCFWFNGNPGSTTCSGVTVTSSGNSVYTTPNITITGPANDACANATTLTINAAAVSGTLNGCTNESPFTTTAGSTGGKDVWYKFTANCAGSHVITLNGLPDDKDIYLYTACGTTTSIGSSTNSSTTAETITYTTTASTTYYIRVLDYAGTGGSFNLSVSVANKSVTSVTGTSPLCSNAAASTYTANGVVLSGGTGAWSSSNTAVATVDASTGAVTPAGSGTTNIIYTITGGCGGTVSAQQAITVNAAPTISYTGSPYVYCLNNAKSYTFYFWSYYILWYKSILTYRIKL
jgi:hypothetical protein